MCVWGIKLHPQKLWYIYFFTIPFWKNIRWLYLYGTILKKMNYFRNNFDKKWIIFGTIWMYLCFCMYSDLLHGKPTKKNKLCRCKWLQQSWKSRQYKISNFWPLTKRSEITSCKELYASVGEESKFGWESDLQRILISTSLSQETTVRQKVKQTVGQRELHGQTV